MNSGEKEVNRMAQAAKMSDRRNWKKLNGKEFNIYTPIAVGVICVVWFFAAHMSENNFLFPTLESVLFKTVDSLRDLYVLRNIGITLRRVLTGTLYAFLVGLPLGLIMGYSPKMLKALAPFINSLRQIPIMALGSAFHCLVWSGRWSNHLHDCIQRCLHHHPEYHCRCTGHQQGFLQRCKKYGRQHIGYR